MSKCHGESRIFANSSGATSLRVSGACFARLGLRPLPQRMPMGDHAADRPTRHGVGDASAFSHATYDVGRGGHP
jgi:hypothetical protein